jgi:3-oxoacyl-[acyl-carrier-protein] synthase II
MTHRRVLITGLGAVSCLGTGVDAFWRGLCAGGGHAETLPDPDAHMRFPLMYQVPLPDIPAEPRRLGHVPLGTGPRMGVAAAQEAVADAGLDRPARRRLCVVLGVEMGNASMHEQRRSATAAQVDRCRGSEDGGSEDGGSEDSGSEDSGSEDSGSEDGGAPPYPRDGDRWVPLTVTAPAVAAAVSATGGAVSLGNACAASGYAVSYAADMIRAGAVDVALAGGAEGITRVGVGAFNRLGAADPVRCRPFDRHRQGTVFGDGAAMLVLESAEHAAVRGRTPYAELGGAGWSCDAYHPTAPEPEGRQAVRVMRDGLAEAGLAPDDIGAVIPHATGTPLNDAVESRALRQVFGDRCDRLPLLSLKAMIGHTAGAAGAFACLAAALMLRHGRVPASPPVEEPDQECAVFVPQQASVLLHPPAVLVNSYAFGGNNVSLVLTGQQGQR